MRLTSLLPFVLLALGCTTQPVGARCEQDLDCNADNNEVCRQEVAPERGCAGGACICCPSDPTIAQGISACIPRQRTDSGVTDTGPRDTGTTDTGPTDSGPADTGPADSGPTDTGPTDTGPTDTGPTDTGPTDTGPTDTGPTDAGDDVVDAAADDVTDAAMDATPD